MNITPTAYRVEYGQKPENQREIEESKNKMSKMNENDIKII